MKGETNYKRATELLKKLHEKYKQMTKIQISDLHNKYLYLLRQAAYKGHVEAQYELGLNYEDQNYFVPNPKYNPARRFYWYLKAAKVGHAAACNNLAAIYEKGEGTKKDLKKALEYYKRSFELGCSYAKENYNLLSSQMKKAANKNPG